VRCRRRHTGAVPSCFVFGGSGAMRAVGAVFASVVLMIGLSARPASAQQPCSGASPIVCENALAGTPQSEWDIEGAGDPSIQGFATDMSVAPGQRLAFKIDTDATAYRLEIYRVGYYGGHGARRIATIDAVTPLAQPGCLYHVNTGLIDCGNWLQS